MDPLPQEPSVRPLMDYPPTPWHEVCHISKGTTCTLLESYHTFNEGGIMRMLYRNLPDARDTRNVTRLVLMVAGLTAIDGNGDAMPYAEALVRNVTYAQH